MGYEIYVRLCTIRKISDDQIKAIKAFMGDRYPILTYIKWYNIFTDFNSLSKQFPEISFVIYIIGEDINDLTFCFTNKGNTTSTKSLITEENEVSFPNDEDCFCDQYCLSGRDGNCTCGCFDCYNHVKIIDTTRNRIISEHIKDKNYYEISDLLNET